MSADPIRVCSRRPEVSRPTGFERVRRSGLLLHQMTLQAAGTAPSRRDDGSRPPASAGGNAIQESAMHSMTRLAAAATLALLAATAVQAQQRSVGAAPSKAPAASTRAAQAAPNPSGLRPPIPAGLTSGSGAAVAGDPVAANNSVTRGNAAGIGNGTPNGTANGTLNGAPSGAGITAGSGVDGGLAGGGVNAGVDANGNPTTAVAGAGAGGLTARGPSQSVPLGSSGLNPVEVARNFINADANRDGELTRAEASRLSFSMSSFEEMDRDFDGVVTRAEYGDGTR
ncbi:MAG: hypothetical protein EON88_28620 [Brevundimonas sp.]|nr:MAG: hypothetical protein EON88_28620 [Brevundimonas sp.]